MPIAASREIYSLLEEMIVTVPIPGRGIFHPKIWAIRFASPDGSIIRYRLAVMTRNLTSDRSWDLCLKLE